MLKKLNHIRNLLINYQRDNNVKFGSVDNKCKIYLDLNNNYEIKEIGRNDDDANVDSEEDDFHYHGVTHINVQKWVSYKPGVRIADLSQTEIEWLGVRLRFKNGDEIPIEIVLHSFLHELAHTVTIPEQRLCKNLNRRTKQLQSINTHSKKNHFMPCHHSDNFYRNFATILRMSEAMGIYRLPNTHRNFTPNAIQRYDCMFNPEDKMSVGSTDDKYKMSI